MYRFMVSISALAAAMSVMGSSHANDLAAQLDATAPHINAEDFAALGGPDDASGILSDLDGQWFTLNNIVRNWGSEGVGFGPDDLDASRTRTCSDDWETRVTYEVTGPTDFAVHEILRTYDAKLTQHVSLVEGRRFSISVDEDALMASYGLDEADAEQRTEMREMMQLIESEGVEFWRPTADLLVSVGPFGVDVTGRCPT